MCQSFPSSPTYHSISTSRQRRCEKLFRKAFQHCYRKSKRRVFSALEGCLASLCVCLAAGQPNHTVESAEVTAHVPTTHPTTQATHRRSSAEAAPRSHAATRVPSTSQDRREPETGAELHAEVTPGRMTPSGCRGERWSQALEVWKRSLFPLKEKCGNLCCLYLSLTHISSRLSSSPPNLSPLSPLVPLLPLPSMSLPPSSRPRFAHRAEPGWQIRALKTLQPPPLITHLHK